LLKRSKIRRIGKKERDGVEDEDGEGGVEIEGLAEESGSD